MKAKKSDLFRPEALEKLSSPERLDFLVELVQPKDWIILATLGGLITVGLGWSIFGQIPVELEGKGILIQPDAVIPLNAPINGQIKTLNIQPHQCFRKGRVLATLEPIELKEQLKLQRSKLTQIQAQAQDFARQIETRSRPLMPEKLEYLEYRNNQINQIQEVKRNIEELETKIARNSKIISSFDGCILEFAVTPGQVINRGAYLGRINIDGKQDTTIVSAYFPSGIRLTSYFDKEVAIIPDTVSPGEGAVIGKLISASLLPVTQKGAATSLGNDEIVPTVVGTRGGKIEARIAMKRDLSTYSGYRWTSGKGPKVKLYPGSSVRVKIKLKDRSPISFLIPMLETINVSDLMPFWKAKDNQPQSLPIKAYFKLRGKTILLEVAKTKKQREKGLMYRTFLAENRGMLFIYNPPRQVSFWMKNTLIPLDIIFVRDGQVKSVLSNFSPCKSDPCPSYGPFVPIDQVIELPAGQATKLGIKIGDDLAVKFK